MELRHIRYFVALAEELNFTRAAARLGIGQPPLSQQIKDLEAELGVMLLRRLPHGAELTDAGKAFLRTGQAALTAAKEAMGAAKRAARGEAGLLRLGFTGSAHFNSGVPSAIRSFRQAYPGVELRLEEANTYRLFDLLERGDLDAAFTHSGIRDKSRLTLVPVERDTLVIALAASHRHSGQSTVRLIELAEDDFIMKPRHVGPDLHRIVLEACRTAGFEPRLGQEAPQLATVISLVAAELGVSVVPASMQCIHAAGVVFRPIGGAQAAVTLSLAWRRDERSNVVRNFVSMARSRASAAESGLHLTEAR